METRTPINSRMVEYQCDECGEGKMIPTGIANAYYLPDYEHRCNNCGYITYFSVKYPYVEYFNPGEEQ